MIICVLYADNSLSTCTVEQEAEAEEQSTAIESWKVLHDFFKKNIECIDDASLSEGVGDSIVRILINDWDDIALLQNMANTDQDFRAFILRHIDELMTPDQSRKIDKLAHQLCPKNAQYICKDIKGQINRLNQRIKRENKARNLTAHDIYII